MAIVSDHNMFHGTNITTKYEIFFSDKFNENSRFSKSKDVSNQTKGDRSWEGGNITVTTKKISQFFQGLARG